MKKLMTQYPGRLTPKPEPIRKAPADQLAHERCVLQQIGDGGNAPVKK